MVPKPHVKFKDPPSDSINSDGPAEGVYADSKMDRNDNDVGGNPESYNHKSPENAHNSSHMGNYLRPSYIRNHGMKVNELAEPVKEIKDKWKILPCYFGMRGIARQHINSYDDFVLREIKEIMNAPSNKIIRTDVDPQFMLEFVDIRIGKPCIEENMVAVMLTPQMCRIRDLTYSAPIYVDVDYVRGPEFVRKENLEIGRLPVMLRSCVCALSKNVQKNSSDNDYSEYKKDSSHNKYIDEVYGDTYNKDFDFMSDDYKESFYEFSRLNECPYDPGGYFIIKGVEKVILMQEQLSKSRIIVEMDQKKNICASITSATAESKSRTSVVYKNGQLYVRLNSFTDDVPLCIVLKAMGVETDQEIAQLIGSTKLKGKTDMDNLAYSNDSTDDIDLSGTTNYKSSAMGSTHGNSGSDYSLSLHDLYNEGIHSRLDALLYIGRKIRPRPIAKGFFSSNKDSTPKTRQSILEDTHDLFSRVLLSHVPMRDCRDFSGKIKTLCLMARRVLNVVSGNEPLDDKDHYGNKRLELAGQLISILFEDLYKKFIAQFKKQIDQTLDRFMDSKSSGTRDTNLQYPDIIRNLPTDILTRGMQTAISTGNWNIKRFKMERSGVSHVLSRLSYISCIGMMAKSNSQVEKGRKVSGPRALQPSQFGLICPCDTPEGESCGLVKNLSLMSHVTSDGDVDLLISLLYWLGVESFNSLTASDGFDDPSNSTVLLNGILLGVHQNSKELIRNIISLRRRGIINPFVSVYENYHHRQVHVSSDGGRLCRPLIVVENGFPLLTDSHINDLVSKKISLDYLFQNGILEWIDVNEENNLLIVMRESDITIETTHLEISPMSILGVVAGLIPFPNHNQSPRNTYQCAMGKQSIGTIGYNQLNRCDTIIYLLAYTQKPLVTTKAIQLVNFDKLPAGQNAIVAVMSYQGYEIEDAIVINRASCDRGFGRCFSLRRITQEIEKSTDSDLDLSMTYRNVSRCITPFGSKVRSMDGNMRPNTNVDYVINVGERVTNQQVILDKSLFSTVNSQLSLENLTITRKISTNQLVDPLTVLMDTSSEQSDPNKKNVSFKEGSVSVSSTGRVPLANFGAGSKMKAVKYPFNRPAYIDRIICSETLGGTRLYKIMLRQMRSPEVGDKFSSRHGQKGVVGLIESQENLPFSEFGWVPDLVMNPHGFPSRMTVGKMLELVASKAAVLDGLFKDGTPFQENTLPEIERILESKGFHKAGKEILYSGITGEPLETYIFTGPIYYQRLKHMVQDKIHARSRGPRHNINRQPTEGRSRDGGLRLGEMERDCLIAYGASGLIVERLMLSSDVFTLDVCRRCGFIGYDGWCTYCKQHGLTVQVAIPYACKLLFQELQAMNIKPSIILREGRN
ncbi:DNA-directed RNA polymerase III subunit, putative [Theileria equi strain WA]|uniref:DNA-directed RNA polymerase subunit beta n=1 Tax=Theileria equi strain WA TaxID=1537102 RepID=L1LCN0_THEEQ|nr:DNA-directed RNA polymerase III subunit, putative [Theileria equi strain WA]EKX73192.1 DNA-directed RNA polymerase III subunit, putative [Theileria equi strain WA]|eukprot:XP_004832644.1 DNA-directed RNA polymerase III subunit, putative [Theileria equi strain WA]